MSVKKVSEILFEKYCDKRLLHWRKIPEGTERRPDYFVLVKNQLVVFEIKQFDLNESDKKIWQQVNEGKTTGYAVQTKYRVRKKIKKGKDQLKRFSSKPSILLLFDNTGGLLGLDSDDILQAMHGDETFKYLIPNSLELEPLMIDHSFGKNQKLTEQRSTYISGIARLIKPHFETEYQLHFFHNYYSTNKLNSSIGSTIFDKQFELVKNKNDNFAEWKEIKNGFIWS